MAGAQISTSVSILSSLRGFTAISLSGMITTSIPTILAGSVVEVSGAFFSFASTETINATSWSVLSTTNSAFISLIPAGTAGSQTITAEYTLIQPVWVASKGGYYASAASSNRIIGQITKNSATASYAKSPYRSGQLQTAYYWTGEWNMEGTASKGIFTNMDPAGGVKVLDISVIIWDDSASSQSSFERGGYWEIEDSGVLYLYRTGGGVFDSASYNATSGTIANRGDISISFYWP